DADFVRKPAEVTQDRVAILGPVDAGQTEAGGVEGRRDARLLRRFGRGIADAGGRARDTDTGLIGAGRETTPELVAFLARHDGQRLGAAAVDADERASLFHYRTVIDKPG